MITVKQLREALAALPDELPIVITNDCWQWVIKPEEMPKIALWDGKAVGTPATAEKLASDRDFMGDDWAAKYEKQCVVIGWIE